MRPGHPAAPGVDREGWLTTNDAPLFDGESGWWDFIHESRTDLAQLCGSLFLLIVGAGVYSIDAA